MDCIGKSSVAFPHHFPTTEYVLLYPPPSPRMSSLYLTSYISSPLFLQELEKRKLPYDALFFETQKPSSESLLDYRTEMLEQTSNPLFILHQLPLSFLTPLLTKWQDKPFTIINLFTGIGSLGRKLNAEFQDMDPLPREFPKYEPLDLMNFFQILEQPHTKYLRIPYQHFPQSIFSTEEIGIIDAQMLTTLETFSLKTYGYSGENGTIIATGANFPTLLQLGDLLQSAGNAMDLFTITKFPLQLTQEMKDSLHQTKKLFFISDFLPSQARKDHFHSSLKSQGFSQGEIHYLSPHYQQVTTIFDEFSTEQAGFDAKGLAERILEK